MSSCGKCKNLFARQEKFKIICITCGFIYHWNCVNITEREAKFLQETLACVKWVHIKRLHRSFSLSEGDEQDNLVVMDDIKELIKSSIGGLLKQGRSEISIVNSNLKHLENEINKSIEFFFNSSEFS